jgi:hypothetical protein
VAIRFPQHDLPHGLGNRLSGASDTWDNELGGDLVTADFFEPAAGAVTATLAVTLADATLASTATVTPAAGAVTATLAATLADATLASTATVTPAAAAVTATLAATLQDATLSATATVPAAPVPITTSGGGSNKSWRRKAKEAQALRRAIREALAQPDPVVVPVVVEAAEAVPERVREAPNWDLPRPQDYRSEQAHLAALTRAVEQATAVARRIQAQRAAQDKVARDELVARRKAKAAKVARIVRLLEMVDAA